jgi:hypothetical protein
MMDDGEWYKGEEKMQAKDVDEYLCIWAQTTFLVIHVGGKEDIRVEVSMQKICGVGLEVQNELSSTSVFQLGYR